MRRGHVDQARIVGQSVGHEALGVDGHAHHPRAVRGEHPAHRPVAGVLHGDPLARFEQDPGDQVDRLLAAAGDEDVVGHCPHRAGDADVPGDRGPQRADAGRVDVGRRADGARPQLLGHERTPGGVREAGGVRDSGTKVEVGVEVAHHEGLVQAVPDRTRTQRRGGRPLVRVRVGRGADERPRADPAVRRSPRRAAGRRPRRRWSARPPAGLPAPGSTAAAAPAAPALPRSPPGSGRTSWSDRSPGPSRLMCSSTRAA